MVLNPTPSAVHLVQGPFAQIVPLTAGLADPLRTVGAHDVLAPADDLIQVRFLCGGRGGGGVDGRLRHRSSRRCGLLGKCERQGEGGQEHGSNPGGMQMEEICRAKAGRTIGEGPS